jgi:branched-chain amino acid transport system substrate-binding protein
MVSKRLKGVGNRPAARVYLPLRCRKHRLETGFEPASRRQRRVAGNPSGTLFIALSFGIGSRPTVRRSTAAASREESMVLFRSTVALVLALGATFATPALAQKKYDTGASDTEIKVGQTIPLSGPASAYGSIGKVQAAYVRMINEQGGINGRKINLIQYDDAYSPPKTVEQVRKLVEGDEVLTTFQIIGTPPNAAVQKYLNEKKVPQLLAATGATRFTDPKNFPWTIAFNPNYQSEAHIYARYILANHPDAKIAILYQNDDLGKDYVKGLKDALGAKASSMIVAEKSYELSDPTVDSQMVTLKSSGADLFYNITTPKFGAQAIKKAAELG